MSNNDGNATLDSSPSVNVVDNTTPNNSKMGAKKGEKWKRKTNYDVDGQTGGNKIPPEWDSEN